MRTGAERAEAASSPATSPSIHTIKRCWRVARIAAARQQAALNASRPASRQYARRAAPVSAAGTQNGAAWRGRVNARAVWRMPHIHAACYCYYRAAARLLQVRDAFRFVTPRKTAGAAPILRRGMAAAAKPHAGAWRQQLSRRSWPPPKAFLNSMY